MDNIMLAVCAGRFLDKNPTVSSVDIHVYLKDFADLGNPIVPIEKIEEILDLMVDAGFLEVHSANDKDVTQYKRYIPERKERVSGQRQRA
jgi:hypothetical protein